MHDTLTRPANGATLGGQAVRLVSVRADDLRALLAIARPLDHVHVEALKRTTSAVDADTSDTRDAPAVLKTEPAGAAAPVREYSDLDLKRILSLQGVTVAAMSLFGDLAGVSALSTPGALRSLLRTVNPPIHPAVLERFRSAWAVVCQEVRN